MLQNDKSRFGYLCLSVGHQCPLPTHCWSLEPATCPLLCARSPAFSKRNWLVWHHARSDTPSIRRDCNPHSRKFALFLYSHCVPSVVDKGIACSLSLHSKTCKYDWSNISQFVRAHFIQMHVCVFVICYIKNVVKEEFILHCYGESTLL